MRLADEFPQILIAVSAVMFGILSGRARASRLRNLQADLGAGNVRGYLVISVVVLAIGATLLLRG